ncbi:hypothetical protein SEA_PERMAG_35 [Microbacterium phage PermaG]|nr:hypothetical protein SEA_PERMAG_35 [Microbacterium phage PermaG]
MLDKASRLWLNSSMSENELGPWAEAKQMVVDQLDMDFYPSDHSVEVSLIKAQAEQGVPLDPSRPDDQELLADYISDLYQ